MAIETADLLKDRILTIARSHAETARAAYGSRDREVQLLKARNADMRTAVADLHAEIAGLKGTIGALQDANAKLRQRLMAAITQGGP